MRSFAPTRDIPITQGKMKFLPQLFIIVTARSCVHGEKYILKHAQDTIRRNPNDTSYFSCNTCGDEAYNGGVIPATVASLLQERDPEKPTFFMFFDSGCHGFPTTMASYLAKVNAMDTIDPVLVLVDSYSMLPMARKKVYQWGWKGPVYILNQDHYGCPPFFASNRDSLVLKEFNIQETAGYFNTVSLEIMADRNGHVTGYSNYHDLPGELRGTNLPKY